MLLWWIFDSTRFDAAFSTWVWPLLGLLFFPWTTLAYLVVWGPVHGVSGAGWILVVIGVIADIASYSSRYAAQRYQASGAT